MVTAVAARGTDGDEPLLLRALVEAGAHARAVAWDDPDVDWSAFDLAVLRSTWDYAERWPEFSAWCRRVDRVVRLANPAAVVAWNADKTYLRELSRAGVAVVDTTWVAPGQSFELPDGEVVVKPSVSAGSRDTARHGAHERAGALAHVAALGRAGRTAMVQPYVPSVDVEGETSLLFLGGRFSHATTKGPLLVPGQGPTTDLFAAETITATSAAPAQHAAAEAALSAVPSGRDDLAYARVDLVADGAGRPVVLEVELIEPSLFLTTHPGSADRFAAVLLARDVPQR